MRTDELDYELPDHLIALRPAEQRADARLMLVRGETTAHHTVRQLPQLLGEGDLLVLNETKVLPARFELRRTQTDGRVEGLYLGPAEGDIAAWRLMLKSGGRLQPGETLSAEGTPVVRLLSQESDGVWHAAMVEEGDFLSLLDRIGSMPLPPYIRSRRDEDLAALDRERYQTIFAKHGGAVAAPTAGLHFDRSLIASLENAGVRMAKLTLHVGVGTFAPVRAERLEDHPMHGEAYEVPVETVEALAAARREGRRIIPIGTTCVRALESLPDPLGDGPQRGVADLMIRPPYDFRFVDGLMTNFHLPRSTLLALVAAKVGLGRLKAIYAEAIEQAYRFYSYGDAMLILPE